MALYKNSGLTALALAWFCVAPCAHAADTAPGDAPEAEVGAVLGPEAKVQRIGAGQYTIDGEAIDLKTLLHQTLPERAKTLRTIKDNIDQRLATGEAMKKGVSLDTKRAECQALAVNTIPRTRCYQELEMLRDQSTESQTDADSQRDDDELERDKLQRQIDAIDQFEKRYGDTGGTTIVPIPGGPTPVTPADKPDLFGAPRR